MLNIHGKEEITVDEVIHVLTKKKKKGWNLF